MTRTLRLSGITLITVFVLAGCTWPPTPPPVTTTTTTAPVTTTHPTTTTTTRPTTTTTAPTTTTTTAPVTTTSVPPVGFPTAAGTGASGTLTAASGEQVLDSNQTYANHRVTGSITVTACNVTISNVEVDTGEALSSPVDNTPDQFAIWLKAPEGCTTTLDHVSVLTTTGPYSTEGVRNAYGSDMIVRSSKIVGTQLGMTVGPGSVTDSYIELGQTMREDHNEDILDDGITGLTLQHNTFLNRNDQTSALSLFTEFGPNSNVMVKDNWLAGGGYTCYCGDGASDSNGKPARSVNVSFVDNVFSRQYYPAVGAFGPGRAYNPAGGGQWTGNVYADADGTITATPVPQPSLDGQ
jgi:hypothetical protein